MPDRNAKDLATALIGFGEAAAAIVEGWGAAAPSNITAYDLKTAARGAVADAQWVLFARAGVSGRGDEAAALAGAKVVFSLVTADQARVAAEAAAPHLEPGALYLDGNSCAPQTKVAAAKAVEGAGARYVDAAIMAPIHPQKHRTPILISGPHARAALTVLSALDMSATEAPGPVGAASAIKLCRSIMVKGMEALNAEFLFAARALGVEEAALATLHASDPDRDWTSRADYALERMARHGARRAAEMREAVDMVQALGLPAPMSAATAAWQAALGGRMPADAADLGAKIDQIAAASFPQR